MCQRWIWQARQSEAMGTLLRGEPHRTSAGRPSVAEARAAGPGTGSHSNVRKQREARMLNPVRRRSVTTAGPLQDLRTGLTDRQEEQRPDRGRERGRTSEGHGRTAMRPDLHRQRQ